MKLEDKVMGDAVFYIHSLGYSDANLSIKFLGDPEQSAIARVLTFSRVQAYREEWYERDDDCIEMLIGLAEQVKKNGVDYMLHTDQRELWFHSAADPCVEDVVQDAAADQQSSEPMVLRHLDLRTREYSKGPIRW